MIAIQKDIENNPDKEYYQMRQAIREVLDIEATDDQVKAIISRFSDSKPELTIVPKIEDSQAGLETGAESLTGYTLFRDLLERKSASQDLKERVSRSISYLENYEANKDHPSALNTIDGLNYTSTFDKGEFLGTYPRIIDPNPRFGQRAGKDLEDQDKNSRNASVTQATELAQLFNLDLTLLEKDYENSSISTKNFDIGNNLVLRFVKFARVESNDTFGSTPYFQVTLIKKMA